MAESIRQFMIDMIEADDSPMTPDDDNYQLPDKDTEEFSLEELHGIAEYHAQLILELFNRSGWVLDHVSRKGLIAVLSDDKNEDDITISTSDKKNKTFATSSPLQREVVLCFKAVMYANIGSHIYEGLHIFDDENPIKTAEFVNNDKYETIVAVITNPKDDISLVMIPVLQTRTITTSGRAERVYVNPLLAELRSEGVEILEHYTEIKNNDEEKLTIALYGHIVKEGDDPLIVNPKVALNNATVDLVREKMREEILKGFNSDTAMDTFRQEDEDGNDIDVDTDGSQSAANDKFSSNLKFTSWGEDEDDLNTSDDEDEDL